MQSSKSLIAKNTMMLYVRTFLTMGVSLYTSRVILNVLGITDFGIFGVVGGIIWMFSFISNSMSGATQRYLTYEIGRTDLESANRIFNISMFIYVILSIVIVCLGETIGLWFVKNKVVIPEGRLDAALWVYQASIFTAVIGFISIPYNALIISHEKMSAFAYISIYEVLAKLIIVFLLEFINFDKLKLYAVLLLLVQLSIRALYQLYSRRHFAEAKLSIKDIWHIEIIKSMTGFAGWTLFGNLSCIAYTQGVNIVLNLFFGPVVNAARAITAQVETVVKTFVSGFQTAMNPQLIKTYASNNISQLQLLIFTGSKISFYLLYILCLPIYFEAPCILALWLSNVPAHTINFIRIIIIAILIDTQANAFATTMSATGNIKTYQIIVGCILLLILPMVYLSSYLGGTPEIAMLIYLAFIIFAQIVRMLLACKTIGLSLKKYCISVVIPIIKVLVVSAIIPLILKLILTPSISTTFLICISSICFAILSIYRLGLNKSERSFVNNKLLTILSKIKQYNAVL